MRYNAFSVLTILLAAAPALAAPPPPNLSVDLTGPAVSPRVYSYAGYAVSVSNIGNGDADGVKLFIQLPTTATSPQVYVMGTLGAFDARCTLGASGTAAGTKLTCDLGTLRKGRSTSVALNVAFPEKTGDLVINTNATTTTVGEVNASNNADSLVARLSYYTNAINIGATYTNQHCTGTGLTAFFECTLFPGSLTSHPSQFFGGPSGGTIVIPGEADFDGTWALSGTTLTFAYRQLSTSQIVAEFSGRGIPATACFEGLVRFPDGSGGYSTYVAPYHVCP